MLRTCNQLLRRLSKVATDSDYYFLWSLYFSLLYGLLAHILVLSSFCTVPLIDYVGSHQKEKYALTTINDNLLVKTS